MSHSGAMSQQRRRRVAVAGCKWALRKQKLGLFIYVVFPCDYKYRKLYHREEFHKIVSYKKTNYSANFRRIMYIQSCNTLSD